MLEDLRRGADLAGIFDDAEIKNLLDRLAAGNGAEDPGAEMDRADELLEKWGVEAGQIWAAGAHRIACGDCCDEAVVDRLLAGLKCQLCWTDPPWNIGIGVGNNPRWRSRTPMLNDHLGVEFPAFASQFSTIIAQCLLPGAPVYMAMSAQEWPTIDQALRLAGFHWSSTIIWVKDHAVLSRKDYHTRYEPLWYGWKDGASRLVKLADRKQNDVWEILRPIRSEEHPTMKPVELVARALTNSSHAGDLVFEPFLGSGTTAVAAEQTGRICYAVELESKYVAVSLERLAGMGLEPKVVEE
jgi:DNA modification methylase